MLNQSFYRSTARKGLFGGIAKKISFAIQCLVTFLKLTNKKLLLQFRREQNGQNCYLKSDKRFIKSSARQNAILIFARLMAHLMNFQRRIPCFQKLGEFFVEIG